jgi:hypothetical protein
LIADNDGSANFPEKFFAPEISCRQVLSTLFPGLIIGLVDRQDRDNVWMLKINILASVATSFISLA